MKQKHTKILMALIAVSLYIMPVKAHALITATGNSSEGVITALASILIPFPIVNLSITETGETDFFGIAQLKISEHDNANKYNSLKITMGADEPFEIPIPYGSFGLSYLMVPNWWPPLDADQKDLYAYLSVAYGSVIADVSSKIDITLSFEKEEILELLKIFVPDTEGLGLLIGEGPFDIDISLTGGIEGTATETDPTISGNFDFSLTLPEDLIDIGIPIEMPNEFGGSLSIEASFEWVPFELFSSVSLSPTLTLDGEESTLDPITFDLLPSGTFIFYLDQD